MTITAVDRVYQEIRDLIRSSDMEPGQKIPNERELAAMNCASRPQVRDALLMLQKEGLVERKVGSGTYLSQRAPQIIEMAEAKVNMSPERSHHFHDIIEARLLIEPTVAARASEAPSESFLDELDATLERIMTAPTWFQFKEEIYKFSHLYYIEAGNEFLCWTFEKIMSDRRESRFDGGKDQVPVARLVRKHFHDRLAKIADAIKSQDPERSSLEVENFLSGIVTSSAL